ncbi:MAG: DUF362 domain-containing protein [Nitrospirae bacterium]|nr:DUF362 domain-containing protein [Nitrospirota bacterium]
MDFRFDMARAETLGEIKTAIKVTLKHRYADLLPKDKKAGVLIKPDLNSNMNSLTGNTTDLRVIAALLEFLRDEGYVNVVVGEGANVGFFGSGISAISGLRVDLLARHYGYEARDLNCSEPRWVDLENGVKAGVAREVIESAMLINLAKLKTHFGSGMAVCLKNMMGCLVGRADNKKIYGALADNVVDLNLAIKPTLHIVDGVISMEGSGPTRGIPIKTGTLFFGTDPFIVDLVCARFVSFSPEQVAPLRVAIKRGIITEEHLRFAEEFPLSVTYRFKPPKAGPLATLIHGRRLRFPAIRNTAMFDRICSSELGVRILCATGFRQDVSLKEEMECEGISIDDQKCKGCKKCADYCPIGMAMPESAGNGHSSGNGHNPEKGDSPEKDGSSGKDHSPEKNHSQCIHCLYCFCVCPKDAIVFHGKLGFMEEQLRQYDEIIKQIF